MYSKGYQIRKVLSNLHPKIDYDYTLYISVAHPPRSSQVTGSTAASSISFTSAFPETKALASRQALVAFNREIPCKQVSEASTNCLSFQKVGIFEGLGAKPTYRK